MAEDIIKTPNDSYSEKRILQAKELVGRKNGILGRWRDKYVYTDGSWEWGQQGEFEWGHNQVQNSFATLLAALTKGEAGFGPISFVGIGTGLTAWDTTPPAQPYSQTTLTTEYFRKAIPALDIIFIDPITNMSTGGTPSSKLELQYTLQSAEANTQPLREFGLFGGTATSTFDSGEMVNWVVHQRIDKDTSLEIQRTVRIEYVTL